MVSNKYVKPLKRGLIDTVKNPKPPASPAGFVWPARGNKDAAVKFRAAVSELIRDKGIDVKQLAGALYGTASTPAGGEGIPRMPTVRGWVDGKTFPTQEMALYVALYFGVPLSRLLSPTGPLVEIPPVRPYRRGDAAAALPPVERLELPSGTKPATVKFETLAADPRFAKVTIFGTMQMDHVLSLIALLHS